MEPKKERRKSERLPVSSLVRCRMKLGEKTYQAGLRDMSLRGLFLDLEEKVGEAQPCEIAIVLKGENSRLTIDGLSGSIIRSDGTGAAIRLDNRLEWFPLISYYVTSRI